MDHSQHPMALALVVSALLLIVSAAATLPGLFPPPKCVIRSFTQAQAQALVQRAMREDRPEPIRELLVEALQDAGLGRLLRGARAACC